MNADVNKLLSGTAMSDEMNGLLKSSAKESRFSASSCSPPSPVTQTSVREMKHSRIAMRGSVLQCCP